MDYINNLPLLLLLCALDIATTHYMVKRRGIDAGEANPVMRGLMHIFGHSLAMWLGKILLLVLVLNNDHPYAFAQVNLVMLVIVVWNLVQIHRYRKAQR